MSAKHLAPKGEDKELQELLQVVRGEPTPEELATIIAVLEAARAEEEAASDGYERPLKSTWSRNSAQLRHGIVPGAGQWRGAYRNGLN
ncbi:acyl-CoA carboxylase subunit epsilon [Rhodoluna sp.]|jgi:hypothetical protein|uniref:acyl-CoA carboxylase subunit epsilon n=1 Tax=Rhodoluna sp. TaxID=1969481 RepID=UPI0025FDDA76|nr:acyl-CoA carboxylase subunit epsilon [Rhodoluna sp.]